MVDSHQVSVPASAQRDTGSASGGAHRATQCEHRNVCREQAASTGRGERPQVVLASGETPLRGSLVDILV